MTFTEKMKDMLKECGMFEHQADDVLQLVKNDERNKPFLGRWNDQVDEYHPTMITILWISTKEIALKYIEDNIPNAWFKPMFTEHSGERRL